MAARLHYCFLIPFLNNLRSCLRHEVLSRRLMHVEMLSSRETGMNRTTDLPGAEKQHRTDPPCWRYDASGLHPSCASSTISLPSLSLSSALASFSLRQPGSPARAPSDTSEPSPTVSTAARSVCGGRSLSARTVA